MSSNLPLVRRSRRVLPWSGGLKLEINIPSQRIRAKWKGGLINEGGVISSEYGTHWVDGGKQVLCTMITSFFHTFHVQRQTQTVRAKQRIRGRCSFLVYLLFASSALTALTLDAKQ